MKELSPNKQKILLLLFTGIALGFSYSPNRQGKIIKAFSKEWKRIDQKKVSKEIAELYRSKLIKTKENPDGSITLFLTDKGKMKALNYRYKDMKISKQKWDGQWRMVIADVPEQLGHAKTRYARDALRSKLLKFGFYPLQKSVWIAPWECEQEIEFIIEYLGLREYTRYGTLSKIDNDLHLRKIFSLA
ncbi:MAG: hypothetical protein HYV77_01530 [Candidatus Wildermuthbacteria bacterium]|nr:hypothetical protein [Candidatus Wildermuthbacteria bacterium]